MTDRNGKWWLRVGFVAVLIGAGLGVVRSGRITGRGSGGDPQVGCGGPQLAQTGAPTDNPVSQRPVEEKHYQEITTLPEQAFPGRTGKLGRGRIQTPFGEAEVGYVEVDGMAVVDGDITLPLSAIRTGDGQASGGGRSSTSTSLWPGGTVYYQIDGGLSSTMQSRVASAISHWETYTNLDFVSGTGSGYYINFTTGSGCSTSSIGLGNKVTTIALSSSCSTGNTIHEIGHAIGLIHEQCRTDRDSYITINWSLISSDWTYQYQTWVDQGYGQTAMQTLGSYDYGSVMHYPAYCPTDSSKTCITVPNGTTIGQRDGLSSTDIDAVKTMYATALEQTIVNQWWGSSNQGAGMAIADLNADGKPEAIMVHVDDPSGDNYGYYRVAWGMTSTALTNNTATTYRPASYGNPTSIGGWWGTANSGVGLAVGDIDKNGRPDLVVVHVDNPSGADGTYYRIGWNISTAGVVTSWSSPTKITAGFHGSSTAGADVALYDVNGNGTLDLVVGSMDSASGSDNFYFNVGWDVATNGTISSWSGTQSLGGFGNDTAEIGLDVADMDGNGKGDLVLSWVDAASGADAHYYRVGYDLNTSTGAVSGGWSGWRTFGARLGESTSGADVAAYDFNGDGSKDLVAFHLDTAGGGNAGYLYVDMGESDKAYSLKIKHSGQCMDVEYAGTSDGTEIQQWNCNSSTAQKFTLSKTSDGYYVVLTKAAGKCLDVASSSLVDGAKIQEWTCGYGDNQKFSLVAQADGTSSLKNKLSGKCVDLFAYNMTEGNGFTQFTCNGGDNQKFTLTQVTN